MDTEFMATREDVHNVQMDIKHVQAVQVNHADRILRLERRQADDAALKSVWGTGSPFPSVLGGTPQQGPVPNHSVDVFEDFDDEQSQTLLGSLHLDADDEPVRRGASRANSVRFDVSALQGSNWPTGSRHSGEFGPVRPTSGFGSHPMTERSLSHRSDGRHSSAGHSVHSVHSAPSGRASSLGLDTNFAIGDDEDLSLADIPDPPPGLFILGTVPSIIRCWLTTSFSHSALLYAAICSGSQNSTLDFSLVEELGLTDQIRNDTSGHPSIRLPMYLPEAVITQPSSRSNSPAPQLPTLTVDFLVISFSPVESRGGIRVFLGSGALRAHNADILFSRNLMTLYGDDRNKLSVPFVRPEDEESFKDLCTVSMHLEKTELNATALSVTPAKMSTRSESKGEQTAPPVGNREKDRKDPTSTEQKIGSSKHTLPSKSTMRSRGRTSSIKSLSAPTHEPGVDDDDPLHEQPPPENPNLSDHNSRDPPNGIWGSWRNGSNNSGNPENELMSGYQPAVKGGGRSMKVLKSSGTKTPLGNAGMTSRSTSFSARSTSSYEAPPQARGLRETRRKSQADYVPQKWENQRIASEDQRSAKIATSVPRSSNPIGGASAFSWMNSKSAT